MITGFRRAFVDSGGDEARRLPTRRRQPGGLAKEELRRDPFSGTVFVFRSKRADRLQDLGLGRVWPRFSLYWKRLEEGAFRWPPISDGVMRLSASQLAALVDGLDWSRLHARDIPAPETAS